MGPLLDQMGSFLDQESKGEPGASWASWNITLRMKDLRKDSDYPPGSLRNAYLMMYEMYIISSRI